jgi:hypothetical protein
MGSTDNSDWKQGDQKIGKNDHILEEVAQKVAKPKNGTIIYITPLLNSINTDNKSDFHPKIFWPFKK